MAEEVGEAVAEEEAAGGDAVEKELLVPEENAAEVEDDEELRGDLQRLLAKHLSERQNLVLSRTDRVHSESPRTPQIHIKIGGGFLYDRGCTIGFLFAPAGPCNFQWQAPPMASILHGKQQNLSHNKWQVSCQRWWQVFAIVATINWLKRARMCSPSGFCIFDWVLRMQLYDRVLG